MKRGFEVSLIKIIKFITTHPLNRDHKLDSILRFAKWQFGSRLVPGAVVFDWINGTKLLVRAGETGLTGNIYTGLYEFSEMGFLLHFLRPEDLFIDVGANAGSYSILACGVVGAKGIAFEPVPSTFKRLVENMRLNHLDETVRCINEAVGAQRGAISFTSDSDTTNHALAPDEQSDVAINVEVTSLDDALIVESPTVIKIDVEGFETRVIEGAHETLRKQTLSVVIMELNGLGRRYGFDELRILELMFDCGFKTYAYDPLSRDLISLNGKNLSSGNTLFIRDEGLVKDRVKSARHVLIHGKRL